MAAEGVLVLVSVDPERSHRANEAVRIALGIIAGENDVTIVFLGPATKLLDAAVEDYVDGEDAVKHLSTLVKLGQTFHVEGEAIPSGDDWNPHGATVVPVSTEEIADLVAQSDRVLAF